jgi:regulator of replication initiation timing
VRVADAHALVYEVVHREGGDAHLRAAAERTRASFETKCSRRQRKYAHIAGLRDKAENAVVLLIEGPHVCRCLAFRGDELTRECLFCDLRQVAEAKQRSPQSTSQYDGGRGTNGDDSQEEHVEEDAERGDGEVDPLDGVEGGGVLTLEEVGRGDERTREGGETLEALAGVESHRSVPRRTEHGDVRVGRNLKAGEPTTDDKGGAYEAAIFREFGRRPEKDGAFGGQVSRHLSWCRKIVFTE